MNRPFPEDQSPTIPQPEQSSAPCPPSTGPGALAPETIRGPDATPRPALVTQWPTLAGYEVVGELGGGGMGVVYRARQLALNRLVAVKMLRSDHRNDEERARFQIEAEAVARLQHPNIVQIFQLGEQDGRPFFAMELVEGGTLAQYIAGKALSNREAAQLVEILARAMYHAHERGVIHRDLKPSNVLLVSGGLVSGECSGGDSSSTHHSPLTTYQPKISDFGLAKHLYQPSDVTLQSGAVLGTPSYMAPEQASGMASEAGPLCDVYGLGAILYELLTGRPPFKGATNLETLRQVQEQDPVPPSGLRPRLHRDLETICLKCLAKRPGRRYPSALALADDLRRYLDGEPILGRREGLVSRLWRRVRRNLTVTGLLLALLVAAATAWVFGTRAHREQVKTDLTERLERALDACDGSPDAVRRVEDLAAALAREGLQERADQARERLRQTCAACVRDALAAPRLSSADIDRVRTMLSTLEARDPALAERLQHSLAQRLRDWDVLFDLQRTFDGLADIIDPARVQPADGALRSRKGNANRVPP
ncbi:MAG TPA: protein kinase, partial [Gemmataceae bacterium]|nr:protein kinase [Gemmataceae bacterium]